MWEESRNSITNGEQTMPYQGNSPGTSTKKPDLSSNGFEAKQPEQEWPLISGKPLTDFTSQEYQEFIRAKYKLPTGKSGAPALPIGYRKNEKGTEILTVRGRKPKWTTRDELKKLSESSGVTQTRLYVLCGQKDIKVVRTEEEGKKYEGNNNHPTQRKTGKRKNNSRKKTTGKDKRKP